ITMARQDISITFAKNKSNDLHYSFNGSLMGAYVKVYEDANLPTTNSDFPNFYAEALTSPAIIPYFAANPPPSINYQRFIRLKLTAIEIKKGTEMLKSIGFSYNQSSNTRLKLNSVSLKTKGGSAAEVYAFAYNPTSLPPYLTTMTD